MSKQSERNKRTDRKIFIYEGHPQQNKGFKPQKFSLVLLWVSPYTNFIVHPVYDKGLHSTLRPYIKDASFSQIYFVGFSICTCGF